MLALGTYALLHPGHWTEQPRLLLLVSGSCCMFPGQSGPCQSFQGQGLQVVLQDWDCAEYLSIQDQNDCATEFQELCSVGN